MIIYKKKEKKIYLIKAIISRPAVLAVQTKVCNIKLSHLKNAWILKSLDIYETLCAFASF